MSTRLHPVLAPGMRLMLVLLIVAPLALAVPNLLRPNEEISPLPDTNLSARAPKTILSVLDVRPLTGFALNCHHISDVSLYLKSVDQIAELGANGLIVLTPMFQKRVNSNEIRFLSRKCTDQAHLIAILQRARARGMHTTLLPIVLIEKAKTKEWRGVIQPDDWNEWWASYDTFIDHFLHVVIEADVDLFVIGSELNSTESMHERWQAVADRVRWIFKGQIAYSANWDRYFKVEFWPLVDVMCVSSYFELQRDNPDATEDELVDAWALEQARLLAFARKWNQPLLLCEVGYPSLPWASAHPWNYVNKDGIDADHDAQARSWRAFFRAWTDIFRDKGNQLVGFHGYHWSPYHDGGKSDTGYGINGKPAYEIVKSGIHEIHASVNE